MTRPGIFLACLLAAIPRVWAEPALRLEAIGPPAMAIAGAYPRCDPSDIPDAPARAIRRADGEVRLFATHFRNRIGAGPNLRRIRHRCDIAMTGATNDDPAAYDDRAWIASPWSPDGVTVFAVVHNEFHGHLRPALCPGGRYMDCWFNALTAAVSHDGGETFHRMPGHALVAAVPYRFEEAGKGHHGYFNPSNIVTFDGGHYMFAFATRTGAQREGNCLLRTEAIGLPEAWRGRDGTGFNVRFANPYLTRVSPEPHVCAPVALHALRWPVTSLTRHLPSGQFIALMRNGARGGGVYYATSPDLVIWSGPARLMAGADPGTWTPGDPSPIAYPSLLDPASTDRNFETVGATAMLFATRFNPRDGRIGMDRDLVYWNTRIIAP